LSADGYTLAVGSTCPYRGRVDVYEWIGTGSWTPKGKIDDYSDHHRYAGYKVILSPDGNSVAVGVPDRENVLNHVQVWDCDNQKVWRSRNKIQIPVDSKRFKYYTAYVDNGFTMGNGEALLTLSPDKTKVIKWTWNNLLRLWLKTDQMQVAHIAAIAVNSDNSVIATATRDDASKLRIKVYTDPPGAFNWQQKGVDIVIDKGGTYISLNLSADGSVLAVGITGGYLEDGTVTPSVLSEDCFVYMYKWSNAYGWQKLGHGLGNGGQSGTFQNRFGRSVAMNSAGNVLAVADDTGVRVFHIKDNSRVSCGYGGPLSRQVVNWIYRTNAIAKNPHWYPGLSPDATRVEIQNYLYENKHKKPNTGELWCERPSCFIY
jgi:WD40 repeat protein